MSGDQALRVHRLGFGLLLAWFFAVVAVVAIGSGVITTSAPAGERWSSALAGTAVLALCWVLGFRPIVAEQPQRVLVRNPLRDTVVPWGAIEDVLLLDVLVLRTAEGDVRCFAVPRRGRPPLQTQSSATMSPIVPAPPPPRDPGPPPRGSRSTDVVARVRDLAAALGPAAPGPAVRRWAPDAVASLAVAAVAAVVAVLVR